MLCTHVLRADRGVADRGVADRGVADRGVADRGVADRGVADRLRRRGPTGVSGTSDPWIMESWRGRATKRRAKGWATF